MKKATDLVIVLSLKREEQDAEEVQWRATIAMKKAMDLGIVLSLDRGQGAGETEEVSCKTDTNFYEEVWGFT